MRTYKCDFAKIFAKFANIFSKEKIWLTSKNWVRIVNNYADTLLFLA